MNHVVDQLFPSYQLQRPPLVSPFEIYQSRQDDFNNLIHLANQNKHDLNHHHHPHPHPDPVPAPYDHHPPPHHPPPQQEPQAIDEEPLYVNAKQYYRILKRRVARARIEELHRLSRQRKPYLHESRHKHAMRRPRGPGGRFLTAEEIAAQKAQQGAAGPSAFGPDGSSADVAGSSGSNANAQGGIDMNADADGDVDLDDHRGHNVVSADVGSSSTFASLKRLSSDNGVNLRLRHDLGPDVQQSPIEAHIPMYTFKMPIDGQLPQAGSDNQNLTQIHSQATEQANLQSGALPVAQPGSQVPPTSVTLRLPYGQSTVLNLSEALEREKEKERERERERVERENDQDVDGQGQPQPREVPQRSLSHSHSHGHPHAHHVHPHPRPHPHPHPHPHTSQSPSQQLHHVPHPHAHAQARAKHRTHGLDGGSLGIGEVDVLGSPIESGAQSPNSSAVQSQNATANSMMMLGAGSFSEMLYLSPSPNPSQSSGAAGSASGTGGSNAGANISISSQVDMQRRTGDIMQFSARGGQ